MHPLLLRLKFEIASVVNVHPFLLSHWRSASNPDRRVVPDKTEIVIEGFPRSGNTFAVAAFMLAQQRSFCVAHHSHKFHEVALAVSLGIPTLVIVRNPQDAVVSLVIRYPFLTMPQVLRMYIRYHRRLLRYRDACVIALFNDVTHDFGQVIERVNSRYGATFSPFAHTPENVQRAFALVEQMHWEDTDTAKDSHAESAIARPSTQRQARKAELLDELNRYQSLLSKAGQLYRGLCSGVSPG